MLYLSVIIYDDYTWSIFKEMKIIHIFKRQNINYNNHLHLQALCINKKKQNSCTFQIVNFQSISLYWWCLINFNCYHEPCKQNNRFTTSLITWFDVFIFFSLLQHYKTYFSLQKTVLVKGRTWLKFCLKTKQHVPVDMTFSSPLEVWAT